MKAAVLRWNSGFFEFFQTGDARRTDESGVAAERGEVDFGGISDSRVSTEKDLLFDAFQEDPADATFFPAKGHGAPDEDAVGVDGVHEVDDADAEVFGGFEDELAGEFISGLGHFGDEFGFELGTFGESAGKHADAPCGEGLLGAFGHGGGAGVGLEVSATAAGATPRVGAAVDNGVSVFTAVAVLAVQEEIADNDPASDSCAQGEEDQAVEALSRSHPFLTESGGGGIVGEGDGHATVFADAVADGEVFPALEIGGDHEASTGDVHGAGGAEANAGDFLGSQACLLDGTADEGADAACSIFRAAFNEGGFLPDPQHLSPVIGDARLDVCAPQIDSHIKRWLGLLLGNQLKFHTCHLCRVANHSRVPDDQCQRESVLTLSF